MRILIRTAGGRAENKELGLGHIYRTINLAKNFNQNNIFFLVEDYGQVSQILRQNGFFNISKLKQTSSIDYDVKKSISIISTKKIDVLIIDKYKISKSYINRVKSKCKTVIIADLKEKDFDVDLVVNGFVGFKNKILKNKFGKKCLLGPSYQILNSNFIKKSRKIRKEFDLLATFGGYDENNLTEILLNSLNTFPYLIKTKIILGPSSIKSKKLLKLEKKFKGSVLIQNSTNNMWKEMTNAKFGLSGGGLSSYEYASQGIPFGILCQVKHQMLAANYWHKKKIAMNLGTITHLTPSKLTLFLHRVYKKNFGLTPSNLIDGMGSIRVANEIKNL